MLSNRSSVPSDLNPLSRLKTEREKRGQTIIDLTESNPTRVGLEGSLDLHSCFAPADFSLYLPEPQGLLTARQAIADSVYSIRGSSVPPEDLLLTSCTSEAYSYLFRLFADPGETILGPVPGYPLFEDLARLDGVSLRPYRWHWEGEWLLDFRELKYLFELHAPRALLVVHPNNPTGHFLSEEDWNRIADLCRHYRTPLICDEVFYDYRFEEQSVVDPAKESDYLSLVLNGLSKGAVSPQLKLGWILLRGPEDLKRECRRRLEIIADTYLSVNTAVQMAAGRILRETRKTRNLLAARTVRNRETLRKAFADSPVTPLLPEGGWNCVLRFPGHRSDEEWALLLLEQEGVLTQPGYLFRFLGASLLVVSLLPPERVFRDGVERIRKEVARAS